MIRHKKFSSVGKNLTKALNTNSLYKTKRKITSIAIHCSFSPQYRGDNADEIDAWHFARWGSGIGYHYIVLEDGTLEKGRWVDFKGAHVKGFNKKTIGICRIGGMAKDGKAIDDCTLAQIRTLRKLSLALTDMYDLSMNKVLGHNEYPGVNKACPLMNVNNIRRGL